MVKQGVPHTALPICAVPMGAMVLSPAASDNQPSPGKTWVTTTHCPCSRYGHRGQTQDLQETVLSHPVFKPLIAILLFHP